MLPVTKRGTPSGDTKRRKSQRAPVQLAAVAGRILAPHHRPHAAQCGFVAGRPDRLDARALQRRAGRVERGGVGQLPSRCAIAVRVAGNDQVAEITLVHLQVQRAVGRIERLHAQHVLRVAAPRIDARRLGDDVAERTDLDHVGLLQVQNPLFVKGFWPAGGASHRLLGREAAGLGADAVFEPLPSIESCGVYLKRCKTEFD